MQVSWQYFFLFTVFVVTTYSLELKDVQSIASGTSFGMCRGYCQQSINATLNPLQIIASKQPNFPQKPYPTIQRSFQFTSNEWEQFVTALNLQTFQMLDDTIGCPDCADGGAEWIQINWNGGVKRITFENGHAVKGIEELVERMRQLREEFLSQL